MQQYRLVYIFNSHVSFVPTEIDQISTYTIKCDKRFTHIIYVDL